MTTPYANATSNMRAREETRKLLLHFGCQSVGFMDDASRGDVLLAFEHRGQQVQIRVSAKGWAAMWLKKNPYYRRRCTRHEWEQKALRQVPHCAQLHDPGLDQGADHCHRKRDTGVESNIPLVRCHCGSAPKDWLIAPRPSTVAHIELGDYYRTGAPERAV